MFIISTGLMDLNLPICDCGAGPVVLKTSHTTNNPQRKFLHYPNAKKVVTNFYLGLHFM